MIALMMTVNLANAEEWNFADGCGPWMENSITQSDGGGYFRCGGGKIAFGQSKHGGMVELNHDRGPGTWQGCVDYHLSVTLRTTDPGAVYIGVDNYGDKLLSKRLLTDADFRPNVTDTVRMTFQACTGVRPAIGHLASHPKTEIFHVSWSP